MCGAGGANEGGLLLALTGGGGGRSSGRVTRRPAVMTLAALTLVLGCTSSGPGPLLWDQPEIEPPQAAWVKERPWLLDLSSWAATGCGEGEPDSARYLGDFGVGNGRVFALSGYACPLNTLHTMAGPDYQQEANFFPDASTAVAAEGTVPPLRHAAMFRVRHTGILVTVEQSDALELTTVTFAPAGSGPDDPVQRALLRAAVVRNRASSTVSGVEVRTTDAVAVRGDRQRSLAVLEPDAGADPAAVPLGDLAPDAEALVWLAFVTSVDPAQEAETIAALRGADLEALLTGTRDTWVAYTSRAARLTSPDPRVDDLLDGMLVTLRTQTTWLGGVSPMSRYSLLWMRDMSGIARFQLRVGLHEEARAMLDYYHTAAVVRGDISNSVVLDTPLEPSPPEPDWAALPPFSGRQAAEGPSHLPLMAHWYHQATGDPSLSEAWFPFLLRAMVAQQVDDDGLQTFSGDETFRVPLAVTLGKDVDEKFTDCCRSAYSSFIYAAAAEALAADATVLGRDAEAADLRERAARVRAAAEATYWTADGYYAPLVDLTTPGPPPPPFEDVALGAMWVGYLDPADSRGRENLDGALERLGRADGALQSPLAPQYHRLLNLDVADGVYTGMVPGLTLYYLTLVGHPGAEEAFNRLGSCASPSGNYAEVQIFDDQSPLQVIYDPTGSLGDMAARYRPWEGGLNLDAMVLYLTGLQPDLVAGRVDLAPRLPNRWPRMAWSNLRVGQERFDLLVEEQGGAREVTVTLTTPGPLEVHLTVPLGASAVTAVTVAGTPLDANGATIVGPYGETRVALGAQQLVQGVPLVVTVAHRPQP